MAASHHNLRPKSDINWRKLCFGEPLPHQKKRAIEQRHTLPETYHIERIIIKKRVPVQVIIHFYIFSIRISETERIKIIQNSFSCATLTNPENKSFIKSFAILS